jgi:hypothetical protein
MAARQARRYDDHEPALMPVDAWEYRVDVIDNTEITARLRHVLKHRGSQGWELVSLAPRVKPFLGQQQGGDMIAVFKRPGLGSFDLGVAEPPAY